MRKTAGKTKIGITITKTAFLFSLALVLPGSLLFSQASAASRPELDHTTVFVRDIQKSVDFYEKVVGLEKIPDPFKDGKHIWFRSGAHQQLHVVAGATEAAQHDIEIHTAFRVASLTDFMTHLDQMQVKYRNFKGDGKISARPDGVRQIYFQDPDGYWIEVNEDKYQGRRTGPATDYRAVSISVTFSVDCNDNATSTISLLRKSESPKDTILIVCNFTPVPRLGYRIGVPEGGAGANCSTAMPANTVEAALAMSAERRPLPNQFMDVLIRYGLTLPPLGALSLKRE